ncbi:MAG: hypothetical protein N2320_03685 [Candidatus Bipolaricaulota bacterium]|nr:hypothetical protein [Candidatus Bipolaricaulota bacterium]
MRKLLLWACVVFLGATALGQLEDYRDLGYGNAPFNPTDSGLVMRALLRDNDAANPDPVYFTRIQIDNLGTATPPEIEWVELRVEVAGQKRVFGRWPGFPVAEVLLSRPAEERMVPDDGEMWVELWVKVTDRIAHGRTIQPRIRLWWSEGGEGGQIELVDGVPETFVVEGSFDARGLPGPEGGVLNPGDVFLVAEAEVWDTSDVNTHPLYVVKVRVDGPRELIWTVDINNGVTRIEVPAGVEFTLPEPAFVAYDTLEEVRPGPIKVFVTVPPTFLPKDPVTVAPTLAVTVREGRAGPQEKTFAFTDPLPDRVVAGGFETVAVAVPDAGRVFTTVPASLAYSTLTLTDGDRNETPIRVEGLELVAKGTVSTQVTGVELTDARGNFLGIGTGLGKFDLVAPDGKPILVLDEGTFAVKTTLSFGGKMPLGGSLLLAHRVKVEEKLPFDWLARPTAVTQFSAVQEVVPAKAIFFGQPKITLKVDGSRVEIATDGETVATFQGVVKYTPTAPLKLEEVSLRLVAESPYRIVEEKLDREKGELTFKVETSRAQARAGKLVTVQVVVGRVGDPKVEVALELRSVKLVDWAGIELPFTVTPSRVTVALTAVRLTPVVTRGTIELRADSGAVGELAGALRYGAGITFGSLTAAKPYRVASVDPKAGAVTFRVGLMAGEVPAAGVLFTAQFTAPAKAPVTLEITELLDAAGRPYPYVLNPDKVEVGP